MPRLKLKWAYAYPTTQAIGQPTIVGDRLYVSTSGGHVIALNARTGCTHWTVDVGAAVRTAITIGPWPSGGATRFAAYFGDARANVHAVDADTGRRLWTLKADDHPVARITGSPVLHGGRLCVPVSSFEEFAARRNDYACCTFRGSLQAIDAYTGARRWKTYTIAEASRPYRNNAAGRQLHGPAGAAIWSAPTPDPRRGVIYAGTGNSYTDVATAPRTPSSRSIWRPAASANRPAAARAGAGAYSVQPSRYGIFSSALACSLLVKRRFLLSHSSR